VKTYGLGRMRQAFRCLAAWRVAALLACSLVFLPCGGLLLAACWLPLPAVLHAKGARSSVVVVDRNGQLLRELVVGSGVREEPVKLGDLSPWVVPALLAAEDGRFFRHPGVDPVAVVRALGQALQHGQVMSGASTLTQQLARNLVSRPRTLRGKLLEMALALRIEASLSKSRVLEEYLSRVELGPNLVGIRSASWHYFQKPPSALDLAESAALVSLARSPSLYDPKRRPQLLERRRLRVLARLRDLGLASAAEVERAELTPLRILETPATHGSEHLSFALAERFGPASTEGARLIKTTLDATLQREAEAIARAAGPMLSAHGGGAISLIVLDNLKSEVLAYVGSPEYFDSRRLGANDGVVALRQPGSTLKPFVYAAAMTELGYDPATLLPDLPRDFQTPTGRFSPRNYDQRFRGPVLLRQALASSLNVPAVEVASRLGPPRLLSALRRFGFASLDRSAEHYGVALALGDGEVSLLELATAYSALARGGELQSPQLVLERSVPGGEVLVERPHSRARVLDARVAALVTDMLADDAARAAGFGRDSVLHFSFPVAAKTGTSKGFRDNWALGYTREVTVGVWVGNFDGTPLREASGITAAGPAFHELMLAAMRGKAPGPLFDAAGLSRVEICSLSGRRAGAACQHRRLERFIAGQEPAQACELHVLATTDAEGRLTDPSCGGAVGGAARPVEVYPTEFQNWAHEAGRAAPSRQVSPTCPPKSLHEASGAPRVAFPISGQTFAFDPDGPSQQELVLSANAAGARVRFIMDGRDLGERGAPFRLPWRLALGEHEVMVESDGRQSSKVRFRVR